MARMRLVGHVLARLQLFSTRIKERVRVWGLGFRVLKYDHDGFRMH
jgi:hypothetical protein